MQPKEPSYSLNTAVSQEVHLLLNNHVETRLKVVEEMWRNHQEIIVKEWPKLRIKATETYNKLHATKGVAAANAYANNPEVRAVLSKPKGRPRQNPPYNRGDIVRLVVTEALIAYLKKDNTHRHST